jgi:hypothetical protein
MRLTKALARSAARSMSAYLSPMAVERKRLGDKEKRAA